MTPAQSAQFNHTRALRAHCDNLYEFNYEEPLARFGIVALRAQLARLVVEKKIDVFFLTIYGDNYLLPLEFLLELKKTTRIVLWCWDDESSFARHSRYYAQAVDAVVTTDCYAHAGYRALGVPAVLCYGNWPAEPRPAPRPVRDIDVSFVGHRGKADRPAYLDFLAENGIKVQTFGFQSPGGYLAFDDLPRIYMRSKINLNFSRLEAGSARGLGHKGRTSEVAMRRAFCLSEFYPALPRIFEIGKEIDVFTDRRSLLEKVRYYLSHDAEREAIADRAYERALRDYEDGPYFDRVMEELAAIFSGPARPAAVLKSPEFKKRQVAGLFLHGLSQLRHGHPGVFSAVIPELFQYGPRAFLRGAASGLADGLDILRRKFG